MLRAFRIPNGSTIQIVAWLALPAILLVAPGCGGSPDKKPKQTAVAQSGPAQDEETDAAPAQPVKKPGKKAVEKKAEPDVPPPSTVEVTKWGAKDLNDALLRRDVKFIMGAVFFGMRQPNNAKNAVELDGLLQKVARLKDDPTPEVPIPAGLLAEADTDEPSNGVAVPGSPAAAAAAAAAPKRGGSPFRMGGMRRGGDGGK